MKPTEEPIAPTNGARPAARPRVVVIGGGFGGVAAARALGRGPVDVTLIDRRNHLLFQPLLYQVATATLDSCDIAEPLRTLFHRHRNVDVILGEVDQVDPDARLVHLRGGDDAIPAPRTLPYDYLILASGCTGSYFGHDEYAQYAPGLKSLEDALEMRRRVLSAFEFADREADPEVRKELTDFVIVGAGPTGVELAGALADLAHRTPASEYPHLRGGIARFMLVEGGPRVLPSYPPNLSAAAERQLRELGVEVWTNARVTHVDDRHVTIGDERIATRTVLWAAGITASPLAEAARRTGGPSRARGSGCRSPRPRLAVCLRHRGYRGGHVQGSARPGCCARGRPAGASRGEEHCAPDCRTSDASFPVLEQGNDRDHRPPPSRGLLDLGRIQLSGVLAALT